MKKIPLCFEHLNVSLVVFLPLTVFFFFSVVLRVFTFYLFLVKLSITRKKHSRFVMKSVKKTRLLL